MGMIRVGGRRAAFARDLVAGAALPLLIGAYPVLFLFAYNIDEQVTLGPLWGPLGIALGGMALAYLVAALLLRDAGRAALLAGLGGALFFGYGHALNAAQDWLPNQWLLIAAWIVLATAGSVLILRGRRWIGPVSRGLTVLAALAVAFNAWQIGSYAATGGGLVHAVRATQNGDLRLAPAAQPRDVYYIILDRYAGLDALAAEYGYDNTPFYAELEDRGFYVARDSHANYIKTALSVTSSLSMDYLDGEALEAEAKDNEDRGPIHSRLRGELPVPHALTEAGYSYVHIANWWEPTITNADADRTYRYEGQSEFTSALWQTTLVRAFSAPEATPADPWDWPVLRQHSLYQLEKLHAVAELGGPKYVFAHFMLPHDPYVFDVDGSFMDREQVAAQGQTDSYLRQLAYTNQRILEIIDHILAESEVTPIIVLQADEGPFPDRYRAAGEWGFDWHDATREELVEKFNILNAYLLPEVDPQEAGLTPTTSPVNSFRIVFNAYFGTDLSLLADRSYAHTDLHHFFDFFEITDELHAD
jgi:Sulfatase